LETWAAPILIPPDTLGSTEGAPAIRMREIQAEAKTSTLLEYHVLDDGIAIWVVNQSGKVFSFKQNIPKARLQALIDSARQVLGVAGFGERNVKAVASGRETRTPVHVLQTLDSLLIQPVARYLPADSSRELIILPHDILFLLPFASLIDSSGKYLVERYTFSTAPSVGLLKFTRGRIREQQYREKPKLLLMGNPAMPDTKRWSPLPGAEQEVNRIAQNVNQKKGAGFQAKGALPLQAVPLTKAEATEAEFRHIAGVQNYLHMATHGYLVSDALRCGLVLAKTGNAMETDGILTTAEIFGLPLNAELVVLSACETGLGQISSDGVAGLSRAFLYAGASSLIVSLWKVSDEATQHLMVKFYEELARDGNKARALRVAQLETMKKYPHPRDWAAFVLVGQPR
jgi:CHAT domain-containing protein